MPSLQRITPAEWEVMNVLWDKRTATAQEVARALDDRREWSDRTVKTLLGRLARKGAVDHRSEGRCYVYRPRLSREACLRAESRSLLALLAGRPASPLLASFVREARLSSAEIAELKRLLEEKEGAR